MSPTLRRAVVPASIYLGLSLVDLACSLRAFAMGFPEGNPFLASAVQTGCFVPIKLSLSIALAVVMAYVVLSQRRYAWVAWGSVALMAGVAVVHGVGLGRLG